MKTLKLIATSALLLGVICSCGNGNKSGKARLSDSELVTEFQNPSNTWRGKPFWSWNGKLEKNELIRQVGALKDMGFGGYFMHSRVGLDTEYLGDEWFDLINAVADEGKKEGMQNYLYDEDRWPSGTAGGYVTKNPDFRLHYLVMDTFPKEKFQWADTLVAAFTCNLDGTSFKDLNRVKSTEDALSKPGNTVLAFYVKEAAKSNFYNGYTMVDAMNRDATDKFIELTHDAYLKHCGSRIGTDIIGIFTDEPNRGGAFSSFNGANNEVSWTKKLPEEYTKRFGGDIIEKLPYLFLHADGEVYDKVKWQYCELTQELFLENFVEPQQKWCEDHNISYTGHFLHEDNLTSQVVNQGSLMRAYEHQDIPGIDNLTQYARTYWAAKQLSSVARQTGKKFMLSELYGCSGWQMSFEDYKQAGDWQALFGINLRCPHLAWYTMKGEAKRDYPASINFQSGWYKDFKYVEDYYARLGLLLAQGKPVCDLLVINPIESVFAQVSVDSFNALSPASPTMQEIEQKYSELFGWIQGEHFDFDYGDEEMMSRLAKVEKSKDGTVLKVGEASYKAVFVGNMATMRSTTLKLLKDFVAQGGKVILAGKAPEMVDVEASKEPSDFLAKSAACVDYSKDSIIKAIAETLSPSAKISDASGANIPDIFCQARKDGGRTTFVLMSMNRDTAFSSVTIILPAKGKLSEWNCRTGKVESLETAAAGEGITVIRDFAPLQEYVFVVSSKTIGEPAAAAQAKSSESHASDKEDAPSGASKVSGSVPATFEYSLNEPNVLPLDMATFKAKGMDVNRLTEVLKIDRQVRSHFGLHFRGGDMLQPWFFRKFVGDSKPSYGEVEMTFPFNVSVIPDEGLSLCVESPDDFEISLNSQPLSKPDSAKWWIDPCYRMFKISKDMLKVGKNSVVLKMDFTEDKNIEAMYLVGNFGVDLKGASTSITTLPDKLVLGDIAAQKLPFYSGTVSYNFGKISASSVSADDFSGALVKVRRDSVANDIAFTPYRTAVPKGDSDLWIDVVLTRRNTFGPLHQLPARTGSCGPDNFVTEGPSWTDDYVLLPAGLLSAPKFK